MSKLTKEQQSKLANDLCPFCESSLINGPEGGGSQNIACSNVNCANEFWIAWPLTPDHLGKLSDFRAKYIYGYPESFSTQEA